MAWFLGFPGRRWGRGVRRVPGVTGRAAPRGVRGAALEGTGELDRTEKRAFVASLAGTFAETGFVLVARNDGMTVAQVDDLRRRMRGAGVTYKVAKNRLASRALGGTAFEGIAPLLKGPTALAWSQDAVAVAKTAVDYARTNDRFVILGGGLGRQTLAPEGIKALSELPSLEALRARLLGVINAPATRIAGVLQAPAGQLARVFAAYAKRDEAAAEGGTPAEAA